MASSASSPSSPALFAWRSPTFGAQTLSDAIALLRAHPLGVYVPPFSPMSDVRAVALAALAYLACIALLRMRFPPGRRPTAAATAAAAAAPAFPNSSAFVALAVAHNVALALASLAMNVGVSRLLAQLWREGRLAESVCNPVGRLLDPAITHWMLLFYLSKFWELFDTVLLVLRGRPLTLLHVWHHASVPLQSFLWLELEMAVGLYGLWFNALVHTFMYSYFAAALLQIRVPWKKYLTALQIIQFVSSFLALVPWALLNFASPKGCTGNLSLLASAVMNAIFLCLFIRFYQQTYVGKPASKKSEHARR